MPPFQTQWNIRRDKRYNFEWRPDVLCRLAQDGQTARMVLRDRQGWDASLVDARFVLGNLLDCVAQYGSVIEPESSDARDDGPRDEVGRIVCPANTDF